MSMNVEFNMLRSIKTEYNGGYPTDSVDTGHSTADHHHTNINKIN